MLAKRGGGIISKYEEEKLKNKQKIIFSLEAAFNTAKLARFECLNFIILFLFISASVCVCVCGWGKGGGKGRILNFRYISDK